MPKQEKKDLIWSFFEFEAKISEMCIPNKNQQNPELMCVKKRCILQECPE